MLNNRAIELLPTREFWAFTAGRATAKRHKWMEEARDYQLKGMPDITKLCVRWARGYHHDYLRAIQRAIEP